MSYRYIGNKSRILSPLLTEVRKHVSPGKTVADLMCGTASVSEGLKCAGYRVIASDLMTFSFCHAWTRLKLSAAPPFLSCPGRSYSAVLNYLNNLLPISGFFLREYAPGGCPLNGVPPRKYISDANAAKLDAIALKIREWKKIEILTVKLWKSY